MFVIEATPDTGVEVDVDPGRQVPQGIQNTEYIVMSSLCTKLLVNAKPQVRPSLIRRIRRPHHHAGAMMGVPWPSMSPRCRLLLSLRCLVPGALRHGDTPDLGAV